MVNKAHRQKYYNTTRYRRGKYDYKCVFKILIIFSFSRKFYQNVCIESAVWSVSQTVHFNTYHNDRIIESTFMVTKSTQKCSVFFFEIIRDVDFSVYFYCSDFVDQFCRRRRCCPFCMNHLMSIEINVT